MVLFFRLIQQEKDYILSMTTSMMPWIADINERKVIVKTLAVFQLYRGASRFDNLRN
jgi:hypothetical protein